MSQDEPTEKDKSIRKPTKELTEEKKVPENEDVKSDEIQKPQKKMTMDEKIAAKKVKKEAKEEEPVFKVKLKKSSVVQRQWTDNDLEVVELKAHKFEQIPQTEMVKPN